MRRRAYFFYVFLGLQFVGCGELPQALEGEYSGYTSIIRNGTPETFDVTARVNELSKKKVSILVFQKENAENILFSFELGGASREKDKDLRFSFVSKEISVDSLSLKRDGACAETVSSASLKFRTCLSESALQFFLENEDGTYRILMYIHKDPAENEVPKEPLLEASLDNVVGRVKSFTFTTALQAERLFRARREIEVSRGMLLPHLNINPLIVAAEGSLGIGEILSSMMPFIFPSRWYELDRSKLLYQAERVSYVTFLANQISMAESIFYSILREQRYLTEIILMSDQLSPVYEKALKQEKFGFVDPSIVGILKNRLLRYEQDIASFQDLIRHEKAALARLLGLKPGNEIPDLLFPELHLSLNYSIQVVLYRAEVLTRSFELQSFFHLRAAAEKTSKAVSYSFLDPAGDPRSSLGFGYGAMLAIGKSHLRELDLKQREMEARLEEKLVQTVSAVNQALQQEPLAEAKVKNAKDVVERELKNLKIGLAVNISDFADRLDELLQARLMQINVEILKFVSVGKLQRLTFTGYYEGLLNLVPEFSKPSTSSGNGNNKFSP